MPVAEGLANVEAVHDAGRELLATGEVVAQHGQGDIFDVRAEGFDLFVFRWPAALAEGVPAHPPFILLNFGSAAREREASPVDGRARQSADGFDDLAIGQAELADAHFTGLKLNWSRERVVAGGFGESDGEGVAEDLLSGHDQCVEIGGEAAIDQREVSDVLKVAGREFRSDLTGAALELRFISVPRFQKQRLDAIDAEIFIWIEFVSRLLIEPGDEGEFAEEEGERVRSDCKRFGFFDVVVGDRLRRAGLVGFANPRPFQYGADEEDRVEAFFEFSQSIRHGDATICSLTFEARERR